MKRLGRLLYSTSMALSLLLCAAVAVLWVRSDRDQDVDRIIFRRPEPEHCTAFVSFAGQVLFIRAPWSALRSLGGDEGIKALFPGVRYSQSWAGPRTLSVWVQYWLLCVVSGAGPLMLILRRLRRRTPRDGMCVNCGYDLRATPDRCPECGTATAEANP